MTAELQLQFDENGLIPVIVRDSASGEVLILAFMNAEALEATRRTGRSHFWSRSRQKLWRKGETSGHEQIVEEILVNCDQNSLLLNVRQIGAVCHDGYDTCYYRRLEPDNSLTIQHERVFDPETVYANAPNLGSLSREWFDAYRFLRDHDLGDVSSTSAKLRDPEFDPTPRIAEELRELAGVLDGTHTHGNQADDAILEGAQVLYWLALAAVKLDLTWDELRPDRAFETGIEQADTSLAATMLRAEADRADFADGPAIHAAMALVSQACRSVGIEPGELLVADLAELKVKPYLAPYFAEPSSSS